MIDFDTMLVHVGEFGLYQKILFVFQAPFCIFVTFVLFGQLFMYLYPRVYWCDDRCLNFAGLTQEQSRNLSVPFITEADDFDPCWTYERSEQDTLNLIARVRQRCQQDCPRDARFCDYYDEGKGNGRCIGVGTTSADSSNGRQKRQWMSGQQWGYGGFRPTNSPSSPFGPDSGRIFRYNPSFPNPPSAWPDSRISTTTNRPLPQTTTTEVPVPGPRIANAPQPRPRPRPHTRRPNAPNPGRSPGTSPSISAGSISCNSTVRNNADSPPPSNRTCNREQVCTFLENTTRIIELPRSSIDPRGIRPCENWAYPFVPGKRHLGLPYPTVVSDERWWCNPEKSITIANSVFYVGAIVGGIGIGFIADNRGRVPALVTANLLGCIGGVLTAFTSSHFILFCFSRFIAGMAFDNSFSMIYILVLEYVGPTYRTLVANLSIAVFYTIGTLILPGLALAIGNWRHFALAVSLPMLLAIPAIFVVPESARWLLSKGRSKEATRILRSFARVNGKKVDEKIFIEFEEGANELYEEITKEEDASLMEAMKKPRIAKNIILLTIIWPLIALLYDGHSRNILNFGDNVFLSFTIASSTEFPADMLLVFTLDRFGRRWLAFASLIFAGAFSLVAAGVPQTPEMATVSLATALISRFWVNVAFNIGLQYAAELLPTVIRAQGVNSIHIMGYVASIVSPFIASIGRTNPVLSLTILGGCAIIAGVLTLFLPETLGEDLPNTLEEGEVFGKNQSFWNCPICAKPREIEEEPLELTPVQLRHKMKASLRGETFRSSIITSRHTPGGDFLNLNPRGGGPTETTRLRRGYTK